MPPSPGRPPLPPITEAEFLLQRWPLFFGGIVLVFLSCAGLLLIYRLTTVRKLKARNDELEQQEKDKKVMKVKMLGDMKVCSEGS